MISTNTLGSLLLAFAFIGTHAHTIYTIENNCPAPIKIFINGKSQGFIETKKSMIKSYTEKWSGFIYSSSNGGTAAGSGSTKAAFIGESGIYYILKDRDSFNTGIGITAKVEGSDKICSKTVCDSPRCRSAFNVAPGRLTALEYSSKESQLCSAVGVTPARITAKVAAVTSSLTVPLKDNTTPANIIDAILDKLSGFLTSAKIAIADGVSAGASGEHSSYTVTFCPSGSFPAPKGSVEIHPNGNENKCLDVRGAVFKNGTPVQIYDCNKTNAQRWIINPDQSSQIKVAGTSFCLDSGNVHDSRISLKIWKCRKNNANQQWVYSQNNTIALAGTDFAVDLTDGNTDNRNKVQLYKAYHGLNQVWTTSQF
ncbi:hypothetical protein JR316_0001785 [Psilocybe cubensis]|uniref:Ricin B lectin domain-containing protein n=2 Tax=Psilocybe cubensis TaxID=181762 RepID=A0A8H7Y7D5_PSICU|nr:hypothetical protein JR316_0001785 [Psilocybe cubensis]KAH9484883.1 hypothetical protein JR316_0001785 [Psilocybe cubensis]